MEFEGTIPKGTYGAGTVKKAYDKPVEVLESSNSRIKLVLPEGEFTLIKMKQEEGKQENWLMVKNKNTIPNPVTDKPKLKDISKKELNFDDPTKMWQPKVDGGHTIFRLHSNTPNRVYSYRTSSKTSLPIEHTHQVPEIRDAEVPQDLHGVEIRGDLYAKEHDGKPMGAQDVGGMLNANIMNSREEQGARGKLIPYIYDVIKGKNGEDLKNAPYAKKYDLIKEIEKKIPIFRAADAAITKVQKQEMFNQIQQKKHPDTMEGIVEWDLTAPGGDPKKYKIRDTHEVIIRDIFPAVSPKPVPFAGGFGYSWEPEGPVVGRVGTGFSQKMREEMVANPKKYIGRVARIKTQQVFGSGAARAPSFYQMHIEKNLEKTSETIASYRGT
jgi:ATP-dependent DNA ligase